ncbi:MAG: GNAT family N-acetyltransferase [Acidobacteriia bacterium]|nr:GNAT family N-acetyltransferase [Terriglobia bacterium]
MVIKKIPLKDLVDFANQVDKHTPPEGVLPISRQRALSQSQNPFASPDDVALLVAYDNDICVGYLGVVPGGAWVNGVCQKVFWLSTWYVSPKARDSGVAMQLLFTACQLKGDIMVTGVSESARRVYVALHFREFGPLRFCNYWIIRPGRDRLLSRLSRSMKGFDRLVVRFIRRRFLRQSLAPMKSVLANLECRKVSRIQPPEEFSRAIENQPRTFIRESKAINWMLEHPWLTESAQSEPRYEFSVFRQVFHYTALEITSATGKYLGYIVMSTSREKPDSPLALTLLDWALLPEVDLRVIQTLVLREALACEADRITLPSSLAGQLPKPLSQFGQVQEVSSLYFARLQNRESDLSQALNNPHLHYTDGDRAFT